MVIVGRESRVLAKAARRGFKRFLKARKEAAGVMCEPPAPTVRPGLAGQVRGYLAEHAEATIGEMVQALGLSAGEKKSLQVTIRRYKDVERCGGGRGQKQEVRWRLKGCQRIVGAD